jgi:3-phenylpropionate/trans-cinnamate dioxygenase ferredoxin subunit
MRVELFPVDSLAPGQICEVQIGRVSVAVLRKADGTFRALRNRCPHQGGPLANGRTEPFIQGTRLGEYIPSRDREVIRCPLHQFEFDVDSGVSPADPARYRVRSYPVTVTNGVVYVEHPAGGIVHVTPPRSRRVAAIKHSDPQD